MQRRTERSWRRLASGGLLGMLTAVLAGCPVGIPQTRNPHQDLIEPTTGADFTLYVPSYYSDDRDWPLVITLHGTKNPYDDRRRQILEWKDIAEEHGLIVAAPELKSTQGALPVIPSIWYADPDKLLADERLIQALLDHLAANYRVDRDCVLLTAFSSGGFPMYYTGLRNPGLFDMLIARDCNCSLKTLEGVAVTEDVRKLPVMILWGKDGPEEIRKQSWEAFRFLRENRCFLAERKILEGGHLRRAGLAYGFWAKRLPKRHIR